MAIKAKKAEQSQAPIDFARYGKERQEEKTGNNCMETFEHQIHHIPGNMAKANSVGKWKSLVLQAQSKEKSKSYCGIVEELERDDRGRSISMNTKLEGNHMSDIFAAISPPLETGKNNSSLKEENRETGKHRETMQRGTNDYKVG